MSDVRILQSLVNSSEDRFEKTRIALPIQKFMYRFFCCLLFAVLVFDFFASYVLWSKTLEPLSATIMSLFYLFILYIAHTIIENKPLVKKIFGWVAIVGLIGMGLVWRGHYILSEHSKMDGGGINTIATESSSIGFFDTAILYLSSLGDFMFYFFFAAITMAILITSSAIITQLNKYAYVYKTNLINIKEWHKNLNAIKNDLQIKKANNIRATLKQETLHDFIIRMESTVKKIMKIYIKYIDKALALQKSPTAKISLKLDTDTVPQKVIDYLESRSNEELIQLKNKATTYLSQA